MTKFIITNLIIVFLASCGKPCLECSYATLKGNIVETRCSSIKADRDAFRQEIEEIAVANGTIAVCTKENY